MIGSLPLQHHIGFDLLWSLIATVPPPDGSKWHGAASTQAALSSTVFVVLGGVGLLAIMSRERGLWSSIILAATGGIVLLLATTVVAGQAMGFLEGVQYGPLLGSSLQSTICAMIFATHYNALAWTKQSGFAPPPAWLPLSVGAGSLVTVLFLWRALLVSEEEHLADRSGVAASATRAAVTRQLAIAERTLRRMSRHSVRPDAAWTSVVSQMIADISGLKMVIWTDSTGRRLGGDTVNLPADVERVLGTLQRNAASLTTQGDSTRYLPLGSDSSRAVMVIPRCERTSCSDLFVAVLSAPEVLGSILGDTVLGFDLAIGTRGQWFRASGTPRAPTDPLVVREPVLPAGPGWEVGVWPQRRTAAVTPSSLSDVVLLLGVAVSVLLAVALRLTQAVSENARMEERATLDRALQSTTDGLWEWDLPSGEVTRSPLLWSRLGYGTGDERRHMSEWLTLVHPQDRERVEARLNAHLESRTDAFDAQYRVRSASGRWHDFIDRGRVVLRSSTGQPLRLLGSFADVTDRRHAEESLRQAETMSTMGRLAGRIAHEINNPLAGIQSAFMLIKDAIPSTHPHFKYVGAIEREIQRISQVTRQLYETYRPETEASVHAPVQTVVGDAVAFLEQLNRNTGVSIAVELGAVAAVVRLSNSLLRQCIYNLVQNAIEASPPGSRVLVSGAIDGADFVLRVRDHGPGVPAELRESIFDPFVSTKPSQLSTGGMGMGLSLVRRAVEAAGGTIEVIDAAGGGAEFIARIPLAEPTVHGVTA
jgi:PAS domain S-box-containing protein